MTATLLFLALLPAAPDSDVRLNKQIDDLVQKLGHRDYKLREQAARDLLEIGAPAADAIKAGQQSPDGEISERCKKLYPQLWTRGLEKRLLTFAKATGDKDSEDLPFAKKWLGIVGDTKAGRELYANMVRMHAARLQSIEDGRAAMPGVLAEFAREVYTKNAAATGIRTMTATGEPDVALYLFLGAMGDDRRTLPAGMSSTHCYQFLNADWLGKTLGGDGPSKETRALYAKWLEKERYSLVMHRAIEVAAVNKVAECGPAALKIAADTTTSPLVRATALLGYARLGTKDGLKELEPFFKDAATVTTVAFAPGGRMTVQVRDVALGAALLMAGQSPKAFGFEREAPTTATLTSYTYYAFADDEKRDAAHAKWKEWAAGNLKK